MMFMPVPIGNLCPFGPSGLGPVDTSPSIDMCPLESTVAPIQTFAQAVPHESPQSGTTSQTPQSGTTSDTSQTGTTSYAPLSGTASDTSQSGTTSHTPQSGTAPSPPQPGTASGVGGTVTIRDIFEQSRNAEYNPDE
jgi:hypothetical protein